MSDWANLPSSPALDQLPGIARETNACGILLVANAVSASEFHRVIKIGSANGLHVQVWPGFGGLGTRRVRRFPMSGETFLYVEPGKRPAWQLATKRMHRPGWSGRRPAHGGTRPPGRLDCHPARRRWPSPLSTGEGGVERATLRRLQATDHGDGGRGRASTWRSSTSARMGPSSKRPHDPRVTRVGAVVRALSLDEIPQLFNVLAGTMSLVGPRPALPHEVAQFEPEFLRRHDVKPGITGLWQVEARDNPSFHAYRRLDLVYVDNWSIGLDLFVLLVTVPMVIAHAVSICRRERRPQGASRGSLRRLARLTHTGTRPSIESTRQDVRERHLAAGWRARATSAERSPVQSWPPVARRGRILTQKSRLRSPIKGMTGPN